MTADSKWIVGLSPRTPVGKAARKALPARLKAVLHFLPLAAKSAAGEVENVHQLRVATRRANAALRLFSGSLSSRHFKKLRKLFRRLRRAAGAARDWDVFLANLQGYSTLQRPASRPALDFLFGFGAARRMEAQVELTEIARREEDELKWATNELVERSSAWKEPGANEALGEMALRQVTTLVDDMESMAAAAPAAYAELHQLRILGKRLRYSMEIFADCFDAPFRGDLYSAVEQMQEILGRITDAHVAAEWLLSMRDHMKAFQRKEWGRYSKPIDQLLQAQRRVLPRERKRFLAWWPRWQQLLRERPPASLLLGQ